jgi:dolichol-phosphate mannosyltransferase
MMEDASPRPHGQGHGDRLAGTAPVDTTAAPIPSVLVVVPTYNERDNLPVLVRAILSLPGYSVLVVDDDSPDGTGQVADALEREHPGRVAVLHRTGKRGLGRAYIDGLQEALRRGPALICQMDADLSHDAAYLPAMVAAASESDVVIGSRYLHGVSVVNWPLGRLILSTVANRYVRAITRMTARDCTSGFRCWRREALARLPLDRLTSDGYSFMVEMLYAAVKAGCRVHEVPIVFVERRQGESKLSVPVLVESAVMPWRLVLGRRYRAGGGRAERGIGRSRPQNERRDG